MRGILSLALIAISLVVRAWAQAPGVGVIVRPAPEMQQAPPTPNPAPAAPPPDSRPLPKVPVRENDTPLQLGNQTYHFVTRIHRLEASNSLPPDETTEWWELRDPKGSRIARQASPVHVTPDGFEESDSVAAHVFATKLGSGVLVEGMSLPSAPGTGTWVQLFGFRWGPKKADTLTSFGPPISTEGEFLDIASDPRRQAPPPAPGRTVLVMNDILRFRVWTGNFNIIYPVLINWITGKVEPAWRCYRSTARGQVERCDYPIQDATVQPREERTFVRLFPEPDEGFIPAHIVVEPDSKVALLQAEVPVTWSEDKDNISIGAEFGDDLWLQVRIDGHEGWIHTQEDFLALGLQQSE